jgi:hypothetical protein
MTKYETIRTAILNGQNIEADYKGYHRVMTPHTLGYKSGEEQCLCYQFAGESSSASVFPKNAPSNWRCMSLSELENVIAVGGDLHTCNIHSKKQTCVDDVDVEMSF